MKKPWFEIDRKNNVVKEYECSHYEKLYVGEYSPRKGENLEHLLLRLIASIKKRE